MLQYYPGLRFKQGEYNGLAGLAGDIRRHIEPRFVVPRIKEFDHELQRVPTPDEIAYITGERIGKNWPVGRAFLDMQYLALDLGQTELIKVFKLALSRNPALVPVARLGDLGGSMVKGLMHPGSIKLAVVVDYEQVNAGIIGSAMHDAGLDAADCILFVDFTGAPLDPVLATGSVASILDQADQSGPWQKIVFQASNFPRKNPAEQGGDELVPRDEWAVFHAALEECTISPDRIGYGDFAADCGEMVFPRGKGGGRAIRHLRYTTKTHTLVVRGKSEGTDEVVMRDVCQRILDSGHYAGQAFSSADDRIYCVAKGMATPGNSSMWREWNTIHHVTQVVRDLGSLAGQTFAPSRVTHQDEQGALFEDESTDA